MKPNAPSFLIWAVGMALGIVGVVASYVFIPTLTLYSHYLLMASFACLAIGTTFKGI